MSYFGKLLAELKSSISSGSSKIKADGEALFTQIDKDITPVGYTILQGAVMTAEATGGAWNVKLAAAIASASATFAQQGLPVVINDMVAVITTIVADMKKEAATLGTPTATAESAA